MEKIYNFQLINGQTYDSTNNKILLLHPNLLRKNIEKVGFIHANVITYFSKTHEGLIIARNLFDKFGVFDEKGNMIVDFIYDKIGNYCDGIASFKLNGKWGFIDRRGNIVIEPIYDWVYNFSEGYARVVKNNYFGLIRKDGKVVVDCVLNNASDVVNGVCTIKGKNNINIEEKGAILTSSGINFFGSNYYYQNRKAKLEQKNSSSFDDNFIINSKVNLFDLINQGDEEIKKYKLDMQVIKSITDKFDVIPLAYDLENGTLTIVTKWEEKKLDNQNKDTMNIKKMI